MTSVCILDSLNRKPRTTKIPLIGLDYQIYVDKINLMGLDPSTSIPPKICVGFYRFSKVGNEKNNVNINIQLSYLFYIV